jgi:hypothetical protein
MVVLAGRSSIAETPVELKLLNLAQMNFKNDVKPAEEILFRNTANGTLADCKQGQDANPANAATWGDDRIIRADRLLWLCTDRGASALVTSRGIEIAGARIDGKLDLAWAKIRFPLRTIKCAFTEDIILDRASLRSLLLRATYIKRLHGDGLTVEQDILLDEGFQAEGEVSLKDARIGGSTDCGGSRLRNSSGIALNLENAKTGAVYLNKDFAAEGQVSLRNVESGTVNCGGGHFIDRGQQKIALNLENAITGAVYLNKDELNRAFRAEGQVLLRNAESGTVDCNGGQFINPGVRGIALNLENAKTGTVLLSNGFEAEGEVRFTLATIGGDLICTGGHFIGNSGRDRLAIYFGEAQVAGSVVLKEIRVDGLVELRAAKIGAHLICSGGQFRNAGATVLDARAAGIELTVYLDGLPKTDRQVLPFEAEGNVSFNQARIGGRFVWRDVTAPNVTLDLRSAKAKTLLNEKKSWPKKLLLNGFFFEELDDELNEKSDGRTDASSADTQIEWIRINT